MDPEHDPDEGLLVTTLSLVAALAAVVVMFYALAGEW